MGEPAGKAQAPSPEPHRANPAFGTIVILKGNLASRQVPFFHEKGPGGPFASGGFFYSNGRNGFAAGIHAHNWGTGKI